MSDLENTTPPAQVQDTDSTAEAKGEERPHINGAGPDAGLQPDAATVRTFLEAIHAQAKRALDGAPDPGLLQLVRVHPASDDLGVNRYKIGNVGGMVEDALIHAGTGHNVYVEGRTVAKGTKGRGGIEDTLAVFGLAIDSDADKGKAGAPVAGASLVVETSPDNCHRWLFLDRALTAKEAQPLGKAIRDATGADADTGVITQPYRVAGTPNFPNRQKQARGRVAVTPTRILEQTGRRWTPEELRAAFPAAKARPNGAGAKAGGSAGAGKTGGAKGGGRRTKAERAARDGIVALVSEEVEDRSKRFFAAACAALKAGMTKDELEEVMREHPEGCAGKYLNPDRLCEELQRVWPKAEEAREKEQEEAKAAQTSRVAEINRQYALILLGGKSAILKEKGRKHDFIRLDAFKNWHLNAPQVKIDDENSMSISDYWLCHPQRRQYEGIEFAPQGTSPDTYNLWKGFAVEPRQGDCSKFLDHLKDNIAQGNEEHYHWIVGWFAQMFQEPHNKLGTSLVLRGKQGVGKTKIGDVLATLLQPHYLLVSKPRHITGHFNSHMASLLLLHADEAFWAGNKEAEGTLKDMITGKKHLLELKGVDPVPIDNHMRLLVSGNSNWQVPAGLEERRFAVFDVGEKRLQDTDYFAAIDEQMNQGGSEALLWHLLHFDLSTVDLRVIPKTKALLEQKVASMDSKEAWWLDVLRKGMLPEYYRPKEQLPNNAPEKQDGIECQKDVVFTHYRHHAARHSVRHPSNDTQIGIFLNAHVPGLVTGRPREKGEKPGVKTRRPWTHQFPALAACRRAFDKMLQQPFDWGEDWETERWETEPEPPF